jgi:hypothetical protein
LYERLERMRSNHQPGSEEHAMATYYLDYLYGVFAPDGSVRIEPETFSSFQPYIPMARRMTAPTPIPGRLGELGWTVQRVATTSPEAVRLADGELRLDAGQQPGTSALERMRDLHGRNFKLTAPTAPSCTSSPMTHWDRSASRDASLPVAELWEWPVSGRRTLRSSVKERENNMRSTLRKTTQATPRSGDVDTS